MHRHEIQERQARVQCAFGFAARIFFQAVPFVDRHDHRPAAFGGQAHQACILGADLGARVDHRDHHVRAFYGLQGLDHRELLDHIVDLGATPHTGGVDQLEVPALVLKWHGDAVAGGARQIGGQHPILTDQAIDQCGFAGIGAADHGDAQH